MSSNNGQYFVMQLALAIIQMATYADSLLQRRGSFIRIPHSLSPCVFVYVRVRVSVHDRVCARVWHGSETRHLPTSSSST